MTAKEKQSGKSLFSALQVHEGIDPPASINEMAVSAYTQRKGPVLTIDDYTGGILRGDRVLLSKSITLIESALPAHQEMAQQIIERCIPHSGRSLRVGISGVPGAGKSTFIEALGKYLTGQGHRLAVLAVDPSSQLSGGSILGDKTRMETLAVDERAYVRPSPSAGSLGGVTRKTREIIILCEAAGFDTIFVETVGVGQSETAVHGMVDFFLLLMLAGAGDELQGIKRGIIEMCDGMAINKADGENIYKAEQARMQYENALHLFSPPVTGWKPRVLTCSAITKAGIDEVWDMIKAFEATVKSNGHFVLRRKQQQKSRMLDSIQERLSDAFYNHPEVQKRLPALLEQMNDQKLTSYQAAQILLKASGL